MEKPQKNSYQKKIEELHTELEEVAKLLQDKRSSLDSLNSEIGKLSLEEEKLKNSISNKSNEEKALDDRITGKKRIISELSKQQSELESTFLVRIKDLKQEIKDLEKKLGDVTNLHTEFESNKKILTEIEYKKMKLEAYVRILQNYYDETGIKLNILPEFGLEHK